MANFSSDANRRRVCRDRYVIIGGITMGLANRTVSEHGPAEILVARKLPRCRTQRL